VVPLLRDAGVRQVRLHDDRHAATTLLLTAGVQPRSHGVARPQSDAYDDGYLSIAAGVAAVDFGGNASALMGVGAARLHMALPRAIAIATVAVPRRRRDLTLTDRKATIHFLPRDIERIYVERMTTDMGPCLVTTLEQTVLDLSHLPRLGDMEFEAWNTIDALLPRRDNEVVDRLAAQQRLNAAHRRLRTRARVRAIG
jgi:hypothetical protein